jgi:flagellar basal-body rod modification protein FlgD
MDNPIGLLPPGLENLAIEHQKKTVVSSGDLQQEQFLELMLTQLKNQDPLKPMESGDFLGQIAQFGTVSGIGELQQSFSSLAASLQSSQALQASTMVGRNVLIESESLRLGNQSEQGLAFELPVAANDVRLVIEDQSGQVIRQVGFGAQEKGLVDFTWDGLDNAGARVVPGTYVLKASAVIDGANEALSTFIQAPVESVTLARDGQPPVLNLTDIGAIELGAIKRVL